MSISPFLGSKSGPEPRDAPPALARRRQLERASQARVVLVPPRRRTVHTIDQQSCCVVLLRLFFRAHGRPQPPFPSRPRIRAYVFSKGPPGEALRRARASGELRAGVWARGGVGAWEGASASKK